MLSLLSITLKNVGSYKEQTHYFNNGGLKVIFGINRDTMPIDLKALSIDELFSKSDVSLPSNGSGKSMISEGLNIAIFGEVIRKDITPRDLIRKGEDYLEVCLKAQNTILGIDDLTIVRTIYASKSKPSTVSVWEGESEIKKSSVELMNKYIIDRYIGISKENIINYFIIQNTRYKPFLLLSDSKKKEMIAEFTGINKMGYVEDKLKKKISELQESLNDKEKELAKIDGKIETYNEIIVNLPDEKVYKENLAKDISSSEKEILLAKNKIKEIEKTIEIYKNNLNNLESLSLHWKERKVKANKFSSNKNKYTILLEENKEAATQIEEALFNLNEVLSKENKNKGYLEANISKYKTILKGLIECPKCKHKFNPSDKKSKDEISAELSSFEDKKIISENSLSEFLSDKVGLEELKKSNQAEMFAIKKKIAQVEKIKSFILSMISNIDISINKANANIQNKTQEINNNEQKIEIVKKIIENKKNSSDYNSVIQRKEECEKEIVSLQKQKEKLVDVIEKDLKIKIQSNRDAQVAFVNFKNFLFDKTILNIQNICNYYLSQFSTLSVSMSNNKVLADGKTNRDEITCIVEKDNNSSSFGILSNGEKMNINIAFILTFQHIINTNSGNGLDFLELDEVVSSLDSYNQNILLKALRKLNKTIEVISHTRIIEKFDSVYIVKENNTSQIINKN